MLRRPMLALSYRRSLVLRIFGIRRVRRDNARSLCSLRTGSFPQCTGHHRPAAAGHAPRRMPQEPQRGRSSFAPAVSSSLLSQLSDFGGTAQPVWLGSNSNEGRKEARGGRQNTKHPGRGVGSFLKVWLCPVRDALATSHLYGKGGRRLRALESDGTLLSDVKPRCWSLFTSFSFFLWKCQA